MNSLHIPIFAPGKIRALITAVALVHTLAAYPLPADEFFDTTKPRSELLAQAYGFLVGQRASLKLVESEFPDLAKEVKETRFAFDSTVLGESFRGLEAELADTHGDKWPEFKKELFVQMNALIRNQRITRSEAFEFLEEVRMRGKGEIPATILSALLAAHPKYSKYPVFEIAEGWKKTYRTKGHAKAKGVDFSVDVPASWKGREGNRPNIVQVFGSDMGYGPVMFNLMVKSIPFPEGYTPTKRDLEESFQPSELRETVPPGGKFISASSIELEGLPGAILVTDMSQKRLNFEITMRMTQFIIIHKASMVALQFMVSETPEDNATLDDLQKQHMPIFKAVANTFVLNDRYK